MKKFLTVLSVLLLANLFSAAALAEAYPTMPEPFGEDSAPPSMNLIPADTSGGGSSGGGSYVKKTTTVTTPAPIRTTTPAPTPATETEEREVTQTGPEMVYLLLLGLLLIGGYQFAMKRK